MAFIFDDVFWFGMQINCNSRSIFVDRISKIYDFRVPFSRIVPPGAGGICNSRGVSGRFRIDRACFASVLPYYCRIIKEVTAIWQP
ncbi:MULTISPECIES: hypothetical protein [Alistipes]|uniref:Uncharacterized protein n=2 Tax=Alistipes TaxID=239759 RepID=A0ABY5V4F4_9BACT|nr:MULTISPECIES: hypothetical protein [Alistipes]MBQ7894325.1 hypothetical protein [Alistipes sp.]UEA88047.1 hypothetical protein LK406_04525 [Alistipes senegalensis]UWN64362.1 hypothetical protein NQ519_11420 [Alistipes senegalensis JC50]